MKKQNLCCLVKCPNGMYLELIKIDEFRRGLEIDLKKGKWKYHYPDGQIQAKDWHKIGESWNNEEPVKGVFDLTNFKHMKNAISTASHFHSNNFSLDD